MSDPYKDKVMRISYYSKITKRPKHKQIKVKNFSSEEEAKAFLQKWKKESLEAENHPLGLKKEEPLVGETQKNVEVSSNQPESAGQTKEEPLVMPRVVISKFELSVPDFKKKDGSGKSTVLIASSRGGKTTLMNHIIMKWFDDKDVITTIMCPSLNSSIYKDIRKSKTLLKNDAYLGQLINDVARINRKTDNKYNFAFFIDDVIDEKGSEELLKMFLTYRNLNISSCISIQDTKLLSRAIRHNANNFLFLRLNTQDAILDILELFLDSYEPFKSSKNKMDKVNMYRELTKDNHFIYLDALDDKISFHAPI